MAKKAKYWVLNGVSCDYGELESDLDCYDKVDDVQAMKDCVADHKCTDDTVVARVICFSEEGAQEKAEAMVAAKKADFVDIWKHDGNGKVCGTKTRCWAKPEEKITPKWK